MTQEADTEDQARTFTERLRQSGLGQHTDVGIRCWEGVTYLTGHAPDLKDKRLIESIAREVSGVTEVRNCIRVVPLPIVQDDRLLANVRQALAALPGIDPECIRAEAAYGTVTLTGRLASFAQRALLAPAVTRVPGVRNVVCKVECPPGLSHAECEFQVREVLSQCLGIDTSAISLKYEAEVVYLGGEVASSFVKSAVEENLRWLPYVKEVVNDLTHLNPKYNLAQAARAG